MPSDPLLPVRLVRELRDTERELVQARLAELTYALEWRDDRATERMVTGLMLSFPSGRVSGDDARAMLAAYVGALSDLPPWAVNEAARRWTRGQVPGANTSFAPSSADLHQAATEIVQSFRYEAALLERMLAGVVDHEPVPTLSRVRDGDKTLAIQQAVARAGLEQRAAAMGVDLKEALKDAPDAPKGAGTFKSASDLNVTPAKPMTTPNPMPETEDA